MVKISIKKDKKTVKPKPKPKPKAKPKPKPQQKENQTQSQNVIVNVGSNGITARRRASTQTLQKNRVVNKQQTGPTQINVPQAMPLQQQQSKAEPMNEFIKYFKENERNKEIAKQNESTNELIKYLKETEKQKEIIKEKETKINELEKDKKDKERSKVLTTDEVQDDFSRVYSNSNISTLTNSGTATPRLSRSVDPSQLYDLLRRESDLRGGNPNSGQITFATLQSNEPSSNSSLSSNNSENTFTTRATNNTKQSNLSSLSSQSNDLSTYMTQAPPKDPTETKMQSSQSNDLSTYMTQSPPKDPTETQMQSPYEELLEDEIEAQQVVSPEVVTAVEDPIIDEILEVIEPEEQIVIYEPQRATAQTATATQQLIGIDNSTLPAFLRPINTPIPTMHLKDIIGQRPTISETREIRQARINKLDKKPVLAIEPQSTEDEAKETIKILEDLLKKPSFVSPKKKEDSLKGVGAFIQGSPIKSKQPSKLSDVLKKSPTKEAAAAEESENKVVGSSIEGYDDFQKYITDKEKKKSKQITNGILGKMLIKNKINDPTTGKVFVLDNSNRVHVKGNSTALNNTQLTELLLSNYKPGFVYKKLS